MIGAFILILGMASVYGLLAVAGLSHNRHYDATHSNRGDTITIEAKATYGMGDCEWCNGEATEIVDMFNDGSHTVYVCRKCKLQSVGEEVEIWGKSWDTDFVGKH